MMQRSVHARFSWEQYADETRRLAGSRSGQRQAGATTAQSSTTAAGQAASGAASSIQQLFSLSSIALLSPKRFSPQSGTGSAQVPINQVEPAIAPSSVTGAEQQPDDSLSGTTSNLLANLKSSRFNLRFWQKSAIAANEQDAGQRH